MSRQRIWTPFKGTFLHLQSSHGSLHFDEILHHFLAETNDGDDDDDDGQMHILCKLKGDYRVMIDMQWNCNKTGKF